MKNDVIKYVAIIFLLCVFCKVGLGQQCGIATPVDLGNDTILCDGENIQLNVALLQPGDHIIWGDNSTSPTRTITSQGTYDVQVIHVGNNLIQNGDFEQGNTGFYTEYTVGTGGTWGQLSVEGTYAITTSPSLVHDNFDWCSDHTPAPGTQELVVNGSGNPGTKVWCQTVGVLPNTTYEFSTWISNAVNNNNVAQLQFAINNTPLGNVFTTSSNSCDWGQFFEHWNSGTNTSAQVCITNLNVNVGGNDFVVDDISFAPICVDKDTIVVEYRSYPDFTLPQTYDACQGENVVLDAENVGYDYSWSTTESSQTITVINSGTYQVDVSDGGYCEVNQVFQVDFHTPPDAGLDQLFQFCNTEQNVQLFGLLDNGISTTGIWELNSQLVNNGVFNIAQRDGMQTLTYIVSEQYCPDDTAVVVLDIKTFESAGDDAADHICNVGWVDLPNYINGVNGGNWEAISPNLTSRLDASNQKVSVANLTKGDYFLRYIIPNTLPCPSDTAIVSLSISEIPKVIFDSDTIGGCSPLHINFFDLTEVNGSGTYSWFIDGIEIGETVPQFSYIFEQEKEYDVGLEITIDGLCVGDTSFKNYIEVYPDPVADFEYSPHTVFSNNPEVEFKNLSELNAANFWNFSGLDVSTVTHPTYIFPWGVQKDYTVSLLVISDKGCKDSIRITIPVKTHTLFFVPNAFTPDGDKYNNIFKPIMSVNVDPKTYHLGVYNRWGELLFESFDYNYGWDGSYNGKIVSDGVFIWKLSFKELSSDKMITKKGTISLMR